MKKISGFHFAVVSTLFWSLDRMTKLFALTYCPLSVFRNTGISFGLLKDNASGGLLLTLAGIVLLAGAIARYREKFLTPETALLLAGALGNLTDRLLYGYVVDWLRLFVYFNLADAWLCIGALMSLRHLSRK